MYFLEGSHFSSPELNNCYVKEDIIIISGHILCRILVNSLSIWQSENGKESMENVPKKYKTVRPLLISDIETRRN